MTHEALVSREILASREVLVSHEVLVNREVRVTHEVPPRCGRAERRRPERAVVSSGSSGAKAEAAGVAGAVVGVGLGRTWATSSAVQESSEVQVSREVRLR